MGVSCPTLSSVKSEVELFILSQYHKQAMLAVHCFCALIDTLRAGLQVASLQLHVRMPNCLCAPGLTVAHYIDSHAAHASSLYAFLAVYTKYFLLAAT